MTRFLKTTLLTFVILFFAVSTYRAQDSGKLKTKPTKTEDVNVGFQCQNTNLEQLRPKATLIYGDVTKKALELPKPERTLEAEAADIFGIVVAEVIINTDTGEIAWARIKSGHPLLRESVKQVVCQARFQHSFINGQRVTVAGTITYKFRKP